MTAEERNLLRKAAADPKGQIAIKHSRRHGRGTPTETAWTAYSGAGTWRGRVRSWAHTLGARSPCGRSRPPGEPAPT